jgi:protein-tyrosine phosphatase
MHILIVCTANRCRSPIAAALIGQRMGAVDGEVASAGLLGSGMPMPEVGIELMARRGLDLSAHRSVRLTLAMAQRADLILAMERRHVREVVAESPARWPRTFTLKDFVQRAEPLGPVPQGEGGPEWWDAVGSGRRREDVVGLPARRRLGLHDDEVRDPYGRPPAAWQQVIDELDDLSERLCRLLLSTPAP